MLGLLEPLARDRSIVLVGGQAVAFWSRFLRGTSNDPALAQPLTSKDIDFEGSSRAVRQAAGLLAGRARMPGLDHHTPNTGIVLFVDGDGIQREVDFVYEPLGLRARDVRDTAVQLLVPGGDRNGEVPIWIMHPERCMESRIYNAQVLGKTGALAMRQLRASIACAREWSRFLLDEDPSRLAERVRAVLRINERVFRKSIKDQHFRSAALDLGVEPFDALLAGDDRLPSQFRERRFPQMQLQVEDRRARDRRARARRTGHIS